MKKQTTKKAAAPKKQSPKGKATKQPVIKKKSEEKEIANISGSLQYNLKIVDKHDKLRSTVNVEGTSRIIKSQKHAAAEFFAAASVIADRINESKKQYGISGTIMIDFLEGLMSEAVGFICNEKPNR